MAQSRYEPGEYRPQFGGFSFFPPVIKNLIIINLVMFVLQYLVGGGAFTYDGRSFGAWFQDTLYLNPLGEGFKIWQLVTYMFLHGSMSHIFLNMLMLWMFGMEVENTWGSRKFLVFYMMCGFAAGLATLFINPLLGEAGRTIGASGGVYGVMIAFAMLFPNRYVYFYFFVPVKAKYMITFFVLLELFNGVTGTTDGIAHFAHLGGALLAAVWVLLDRRGMIDTMFLAIDRKKSGSVRKVQSSWTGQPREATFHEFTPTVQQRPTGDPEFDSHQKVIDEILDKIGKSGYSGLTEEEKRILLDASRKIHPDKEQG